MDEGDWEGVCNDICTTEEASDPGDDTSNYVVQWKEEDNKAGQEKEEGHVKDHRKKTNDESHAPLLKAIVAELTDECALAGCAGYERRVLAKPLFCDDSEECSGETQGETDKPKAIDPYVCAGCGERCIGGGDGGKGGSVFCGALERDHLTE